MDLRDDSSRFGPLPTSLRNPSSSSSTFFSASQSPFFSPKSATCRLSTSSDNPCHSASVNMDSLNAYLGNVESESLTSIRFASTEVNPGAEACTSNDRRELENVSSSTGVYSSALSSYGVHHSNDYSRHKGKGKKIGRLLEVSAPPASFSSNRLRSCDVYIGFHGRKPLLLRFTNWLRAELEVQGLSCFVTDRARCRNSRKHSIVEKAMDASTFGVIILTRKSFRNPYTIEELRFFSGKKNLVPVYFDVAPDECLVRDIIEKRGELWEKYGGELWLLYGGVEKEWRDAVNALSRVDDWKLEAHDGKWRDCILRAVSLLALRLGRRSVVDRLTKWREKAEKEEFPFPQNENFVGRNKELSELEFILFGDVCGDSERDFFELKARPRRKNLTIGWGRTNSLDEKPRDRQSESSKKKGKNQFGKHGRRRRSMKVVYGKGIACVSGDTGIGKTELLLQFAYRFHQRYKMVLWIGGESRYIRQNYLNLWSFLEIDVGVESSAEKGRTKSFEEQEEAAIARVRKELMRNIPFLVVIDNLESEKDWWDHKLVMDLLPRFGGETHVIMSTRLPRVMNLEPLRLSYLSGVEAMSLMQGSVKDLSITEIDALRVIEEKLGRLPLGLAIVGAILSELPINPSRLLDTINRMPSRDVTWSGRENHLLRRNNFLLQLFEVCFSIFDHADGQEVWQRTGKLLVCTSTNPNTHSGSGGPQNTRETPTPALMEKDHVFLNLWVHIVLCSEIGSGSIFVIVEIQYGKKLRKRRPHSVQPSREADPIVVELKVSELLFLVKEVILPLAIRTFITFSRCTAALELLRLCTDALEAADQAFVTPVEKWLDKSLCWKPVQTNAQLNPCIWQELALARATVLEVRAKLMARGGQYDIGDDLIRKAIFIRTSICGEDHPDTVTARETLSKLTRLIASVQTHTSP
ncbi:hypothetical protein Sango_1191300 [Sesamum angolense]|uniref:TIR domain-containing protein n=1 Tax=Sesamum angolense TaxID=2727404 RepID=A0AAE1WWD1_9LAMI|nr:hypothetical protein Sango_1191300 [Sesamum angolense]